MKKKEARLTSFQESKLKKEAELRHNLTALEEKRTDLLGKRYKCQKNEDDPLIRFGNSIQISNDFDDIEDELQLVDKEIKRVRYRLKNGKWPLVGFLKFVNEFRSGEMNVQHAVRMGSQKWKQMSEEEKATYWMY